MPQPRKIDRNKDIVKFKRKGWSFRKIAKYFNIDVRAVWEIYKRDVEVINR